MIMYLKISGSVKQIKKSKFISMHNYIQNLIVWKKKTHIRKKYLMILGLRSSIPVKVRTV